MEQQTDNKQEDKKAKVDKEAVKAAKEAKEKAIKNKEIVRK